MTQGPPDYSTYSNQDLLDTLRWLDRDAHPETARALDQEIERRKREPPPRPKVELSDPKRIQAYLPSLRVFGIASIVIGLISLVSSIDAIPKDLSGASLLLLSVPLFDYLLVAVSGILIVRRTPGRLWVGIVAWAIQIPAFRVHRAVYSVFAIPSVEAKLWPEIGIAFSSNLTFSIYWLNEPGSFYLGVNIVALSMLGFLLERSDRLRRLSMRGAFGSEQAG